MNIKSWFVCALILSLNTLHADPAKSCSSLSAIIKEQSSSIASFLLPATAAFAYFQQIPSETLRNRANTFLAFYAQRGLWSKLALTHGTALIGIPFCPINEAYLIATLNNKELNQYKLFISCLLAVTVGAMSVTIFKLYTSLTRKEPTRRKA